MFEQKVLSIDVGSKYIKLLEGRVQGRIAVVGKAAVTDTPAGSLSDGAVQDEAVLKSAIQNAVTAGKITARKVVFAINSTALITRELVLPSVKPEEIGSMIRFEAEQYLPVAIDDYVVEYRTLQEIIEEDVTKTKILLAAIPKKLVEGYHSLSMSAGLKPVALDICSNAAAKLFSGSTAVNDGNYNPKGTVCIIDIGHTFISINILSGGKLQFCRLLRAGSSDMDTLIANSFNMPLDQAERTKLEKASLAESGSGLDSVAMLASAAASVADVWISEISKTLQYYTRKNENKAPEIIYLCGGGSKLRGLPAYMENRLSIKTQRLEKIGSIKLQKEAALEDCTDYFNAAGALIRL